MTFYISSLLFTGIGSILLGAFVYLKGRNKAPNITLALFTLAVGVWCLGQAFGEIATAKEVVLFWTRINLAGAILIPLCFLAFIFSLVNKIDGDKFILYVLIIVSIILASCPVKTFSTSFKGNPETSVINFPVSSNNIL